MHPTNSTVCIGPMGLTSKRTSAVKDAVISAPPIYWKDHRSSFKSCEVYYVSLNFEITNLN